MNTLLTKEVILSEEDFQLISDIVYKHCRINLHTGKKELVRARLAKKLRQGNFNSFREYLKYVFADKTGREFSNLIDSLSTNLTSFFREKQHFDFLQDKFLPTIIERKKKNKDYRIRAWSAGCSSGEEVYSIAITLLEALEGQGQWDVKILGSDISTKMLETARKGYYNAERVESVPAHQRNKYLLSKGKNNSKVFEVSKTLKDIVVFRHLNLMESWPLKGPLDFIFCRNVMIYFDKPTQQNLIDRYWDILNSGSVLFTGHSESLTGIKHKYKYVQPTIYMKT
ncbi:MAG: protein-glutamate O-methyltransferase [Sedimentisphaerales bacterium]|nr:protein-glutamate O-methyltransferase [Sedimentisphaerales bacterium]